MVSKEELLLGIEQEDAPETRDAAGHDSDGKHTGYFDYV